MLQNMLQQTKSTRLQYVIVYKKAIRVHNDNTDSDVPSGASKEAVMASNGGDYARGIDALGNWDPGVAVLDVVLDTVFGGPYSAVPCNSGKGK